MKYVLIALLLFSFSDNIYSQDDEKYKSDEEDAYYKAMREASGFVPVDTNKILKFKLGQIKFRELKTYTPFQGIYHSSPLVDSLIKVDLKVDIKDVLKFKLQTIAGIPLTYIDKHVKHDNKEYIIYRSPRYDDDIFGGYWIAIKTDEWRKFYTGLSANSPIHIKWDSKIDLIKNNNVLQIEAALLRMTQPEIPPGPGPEYELIKDGLSVEFNLDSMMKDSDNDGFTDIEEKKMMLNPYNADSDGDGINDSQDFNPRFKSYHTNKSSIYNYLLNDKYEDSTSVSLELTLEESEIKGLIRTYLVVTDDPKLLSITQNEKRLIFMTSKEYEKHTSEYPDTFSQIYFSHMFKVNGKKNVFKIHTSYSNSGSVYLIKKIKDSWIIEVIGNWII